MSDTDYNSIARTPLRNLRQLRQVPIEQLAAYLATCSPITLLAIDQLFSAQ